MTRTLTIFATFFLSILLTHASAAEDYKVEVVAYSDCAPSIEFLDFSAKPQRCNMSASGYTLMVKGENISSIDTKSINFSSIHVGGKEFAFKRNGEPAYEIGSFPKVDDDGRFALFDVSLERNLFGKIASANLEGSVTIFTSDSLAIYESEVHLNKEFRLEEGPFIISNTQEKERSTDGGMLGQLKDSFSQMFVGVSEDGNLSIYVEGDRDALIGLEVFDGNTKLEDQGSSWTDDLTTFYLSAPNNSKIKLKLKYWRDLKEVNVPFNISL